ncbi:MAG: response regulator [Hyphomonadaceae bacterium]
MSQKRAPILIADENGFNRNIVSDILRSAGLDTLLYAKDGAEMLQITAQFAPKIVIANSRLPKLSGLEFTRAIRAGRPGVDRALSVIIATNTATATFLEMARSSGVDEILVRPFTAAALLARVEAVLIRPRRFIDGINYIGPCRRRRMLEDYGGPMRRFCDPIVEPGEAPWELAPNRELVRHCTEKLAALAADLPVRDRRRLRELFRLVEDAEQLALDVRDAVLARAARSLARYIVAIGAARDIDLEVVQTHVDALQQLAALGSEEHAARESVLNGLDAVVDKRLGRVAA